MLHGLEERSVGGCPDRAWSAAMVVLPFVEGLLGVEPDAPAGRLTIAPRFSSLPARVEADGEAVNPEVTGWGTGFRCAVSFEAATEHVVRYVLK